MPARLCATCSEPVSPMRSGRYCSRDCAAGIGRVLVHSCLGNVADAPLPKCKCKYRVSISAATRMINHGEAVAFATRADAFDGGPVLLRVAQKTPRVATIEAGHIKRAATFKEGRRRPKLSQKQIEELQRAVAEEKSMRESEYRVRWDVYHELDLEMLSAITIEVPEMEDPWSGRCIFASGIGNDERSSVGIDRAVDRGYVPDVFEVEDQVESDPVERDANTVSLEGAEQEMEVCDA